MNIVSEIWNRSRPDDMAVIDGSNHVSYGQLRERVAQTVEFIRSSDGFHPAARVALVCPAGLEYIVLGLAIIEAGGCFLPVPEELKDGEKQELVARMQAHGILYGKAPLKWEKCHLLDGSLDEEKFASLNPALIRFSSGTTGASKGIVISHRSLQERITGANGGLQINRDDRVLWVLPMAHHFAVSLVLYLYHGACTILEFAHLGATMLEAASTGRATVMYGAPYHYSLMAAENTPFAWESLRLAVSTASALTEDVAIKFQEKFKRHVTQGMGVIEVGLPMLNFGGELDAPESVGKTLPGYAARLQNVVDGIGELCLKGPGMFDAYLDPWALRSEICPQGWFVTGDMARQDEHGRYFLLGKRNAVINVGGMKLFPDEIETVLNGHPLVRRSRVVARSHALLGQVPCAEIELCENVPLPKSELRDMCRRMLSNWKVPVEYHQVPSIPMTASGKIRRI